LTAKNKKQERERKREKIRKLSWKAFCFDLFGSVWFRFDLICGGAWWNKEERREKERMKP
jgi:hypothetical protein